VFDRFAQFLESEIEVTHSDRRQTFPQGSNETSLRHSPKRAAHVIPISSASSDDDSRCTTLSYSPCWNSSNPM
jgi:hypothetical protein